MNDLETVAILETAYWALLQVSPTRIERLRLQNTLVTLRDEIARLRGLDPEIVQLHGELR